MCIGQRRDDEKIRCSICERRTIRNRENTKENYTWNMSMISSSSSSSSSSSLFYCCHRRRISPSMMMMMMIFVMIGCWCMMVIVGWGKGVVVILRTATTTARKQQQHNTTIERLCTPTELAALGQWEKQEQHSTLSSALSALPSGLWHYTADLAWERSCLVGSSTAIGRAKNGTPSTSLLLTSSSTSSIFYEWVVRGTGSTFGSSSGSAMQQEKHSTTTKSRKDSDGTTGVSSSSSSSSSCLYTKWDANTFCKVLLEQQQQQQERHQGTDASTTTSPTPRTSHIVMIGDSITWQQFHSLVYLMKSKPQMGIYGKSHEVAYIQCLLSNHPTTNKNDSSNQNKNYQHSPYYHSQNTTTTTTSTNHNDDDNIVVELFITIQYFRSNYLSGMGQILRNSQKFMIQQHHYLNTTNRVESNPIPSSPTNMILIINRGIWYQSDDQMIHGLNHVFEQIRNWWTKIEEEIPVVQQQQQQQLNEQEEEKEENARKINGTDHVISNNPKVVGNEQIDWPKQQQLLVFWRTTLPGHPECLSFTEPQSDQTYMEEWIIHNNTDWYHQNQRNKDQLFYWWEISRQNQLVLQYIQKQQRNNINKRNRSTTTSSSSSSSSNMEIRVLDTYSQSILRPDTHIGGLLKNDCLHYCLPGVPDTWNQLLLHELKRFVVQQNKQQ